VHRIGKNAQTAKPPTDPKLKTCEKNVANESGQQDVTDPSGANCLTHIRRSAAPPERGAR